MQLNGARCSLRLGGGDIASNVSYLETLSTLTYIVPQWRGQQSSQQMLHATRHIVKGHVRHTRSLRSSWKSCSVLFLILLLDGAVL